MNWMVRDMIQTSVDNNLVSALTEKGFSENQVDIILRKSGNSDFSRLTNSIVREIKNDYSFSIHENSMYIDQVATEETRKWLDRNQDTFNKYIDDKLKKSVND